MWLILQIMHFVLATYDEISGSQNLRYLVLTENTKVSLLAFANSIDAAAPTICLQVSVCDYSVAD